MVSNNQSSFGILLPLQAHQLDPTKHYLRLKFLIENQVQFYIPKPEEDVCDLVCNHLLLLRQTFIKVKNMIWEKLVFASERVWNHNMEEIRP